MTSINNMNAINKVEKLNVKYYNKKIAEPLPTLSHIIDKTSVMKNKTIIRNYKEKRDKLFEVITEIDSLEKSLEEILEELIVEKIIKFYLKEFLEIKKHITDDKSNFNEIYDLYNSFILEKESIDPKRQKSLKELKRKHKNIDSKILSISDYIIEDHNEEISIEDLQLVSKNQKFIDKLFYDLISIDNSLSIKTRNNNKAENNIIKKMEINSSKLERLYLDMNENNTHNTHEKSKIMEYIDMYKSTEKVVDEENRKKLEESIEILIDIEILNQILDAFKSTKPTAGYDYLRFIRDNYNEKQVELFDRDTTHIRR